MDPEHDFSGYLDDDAELIHKILEEGWVDGEIKDRAIIFYNETDDPAAFNFKTGEMAIRIYADEIISEPRGISFDSEATSRSIRINVRTTNRDDLIKGCNQIRKILALNRIRPGNDWQTMYFSMYAPVYPSFKFYESTIEVTLKKYYAMLPNVSLVGKQKC